MLFTGGKDSFLPHHHPLLTCCTLHLSTSYIQGPVCGCYLILSNLNMDKASSFQGIRKKKAGLRWALREPDDRVESEV